MNRFYYSRTYRTEDPEGQRKHCYFNLVERVGESAAFRRSDRDEEVTAAGKIIMDGDTETVTLLYGGYEYSLRADRYIPKDYQQNIDGRLGEKEDKLKDAHLHTSGNRDEIGSSKVCYCIFCQTFFKPEEVLDYIDGGETGLCPYCDCDAIIADASGIYMSDKLLSALHWRFFDSSTNPLIELIIDKADESKLTQCSPYVWIVKGQNETGCAVDAGFYTPEDTAEKLADFLSEMPSTNLRTTFEAVRCRLHDIEGQEALDAILLAFSRYDAVLLGFKKVLEENDALLVDASLFKINRDVDFAVTTAWDGESYRFTLLADGELESNNCA